MGYEQKELGCATNMARYFLLLVNLLFILGSIAGIAAGVLMHVDHHEGEQILKFCAACKDVSLFGIIVFGALLVVSFLGFCALKSRNGCLLVLYGIFLVIFFVASLAITALVVMLRAGHFDAAFQKAWDADVQAANQQSNCVFQQKLNCSGWDEVCPYSDFTIIGNDTLVPGAMWTSGNVTQRCAQGCTLQQYTDLSHVTTTCHALLKKDVKKYFNILIGVCAGFVFLTFASIVTSCMVRKTYSEYDELQERF